MRTKAQKEDTHDKSIVNGNGLFTTSEAARYLGFSRVHIFLLAKSGKLHPVLSYYGTTALYTKKELDKFNKTHERRKLAKNESKTGTQRVHAKKNTGVSKKSSRHGRKI